MSCIVLFAITHQLQAQTTLFSEDWTSNNFTSNSWTFDPSQGNWQTGIAYQPIGATGYNAYFSYSPSYTNYSYALVSPIINANSYSNITLDFGLSLINNLSSTLEEFNVEYKKTTDVSWTVLYNYTNVSGTNYWNPSNISLTGMDNSSFQIRFVAFGQNSYNIYGWGLDNIIVKGTPACVGTPTIASASGPAIVCPNSSFTVSASGYTVGTGITFQWQSAAGSTLVWSNIAGATNTSYTETGGITGATDYRLITTCSNSGLSEYSTTATVATYNFFECYCGPITGISLNSLTSNVINNVTISTTTLNNTTTSAGASGYTLNYPTTTSTTTSLTQGATYNIDVSMVSAGNYIGVWIDFDANGSFDASEYVTMSGAGATLSGTINVPLGAIVGQTGMRVRGYNSSYAANEACQANYDYETEDYVVSIAPAAACSGTPSPGAITTPLVNMCAYTPFTISAGSLSTGTGITYQWQSRPQGGANPWVNIAGATTNTYFESSGVGIITDYQLVTTCSTSGLSNTTNILSIYQLPFYQCYCSSGPTSVADEEIYSFTINGTNSNTFSGQGNGCSTLAPGTGSILKRYSNFTSLGVFVQLMKGSHPSFTIQEDECDGAPYYSFGSSIWIDFNHNGSFADAGEQVFVESSTASGPRNVTSTFHIPFSATLGTTGMRITVAEGYSGASLTPCLSYGYGETEDYLVDIIPFNICSGIPYPGIITGLQNICSGLPFILNSTGADVDSGITFQWEASLAGANNWMAIPGATSTSLSSVNGISNSMDFRLVATCSVSGLSNTSNTLSLNVSPTPTAGVTASGPLTLCSLGGSVTLTADQGNNYLWSNGATTQSITVTSATAGNYTVDVTTAGGCIATSNPITVAVKTMPSMVKIKTVGSTSVCDPNTVLFTVDPNASSLYGFDFQWNLNGTPITGATDTNYTASGAGGGSVTLTVSGSTCTKTSAAKTYTIKPLPVATFTAGGPTTICAGQSVSLTAPTITGYTYTWLNNGVSAGSGASKVFKLAGVYSVVAKFNGCTDTSNTSTTVVVNPLPIAGITALTPATFCAGDSCTMQATPAGGTNYAWVNGTTTTNTSSDILSTTTVGTYKMMVTDANGCVSKATTTSVKTKVNPIPVASISASTSTTIAANGSVKLNASPSSGVTFQWFLNGSPISGATTKSFIATAGGSYTVAITKTGCTGTSAATTVTQTSAKEEAGLISNPTATEEALFELAAYPNPVSGVLTINVRGIEEVNATVQVMDFNGRVIAMKEMTTSSTTVDMTGYASGMYLIRYKDAEGRTGTIKINKQ